MGATESSGQPRRISFENQIIIPSSNFPVTCTPSEQVIESPCSNFDEPTPKYPDKQPTSITKQNYWTRRLDWLHKAHVNINYILEREREKAFAQTNDLFKSKFTQQTQAADCQHFKAKIISCYQDHPREPLACADLVKAFNEYVTNIYSQED